MCSYKPVNHIIVTHKVSGPDNHHMVTGSKLQFSCGSELRIRVRKSYLPYNSFATDLDLYHKNFPILIPWKSRYSILRILQTRLRTFLIDHEAKSAKLDDSGRQRIWYGPSRICQKGHDATKQRILN